MLWTTRCTCNCDPSTSSLLGGQQAQQGFWRRSSQVRLWRVPPVGLEPTLGTLLGGRPLPLGYGGWVIIPRRAGTTLGEPNWVGMFPLGVTYLIPLGPPNAKRNHYAGWWHQMDTESNRHGEWCASPATSASRVARRKISSSMSGVTLPVKVFCWLGW
jgi:hypothetical protein